MQQRKGPWGALGTPNKEQNGPNKQQNWGKKDQNLAFFGVLSIMKVPLVSPSLDQKKQICFGHPQFYSSIVPVPVRLLSNFGWVRAPGDSPAPVFMVSQGDFNKTMIAVSCVAGRA